jgi:hypothetical protein
MSRQKTSPGKDAAVWDRVIRFEGGLSPAAARALLKVHFSRQDTERMRELSARARAGTLTPQEEEEIDTYERLGCLLDILHSKARRALGKRRTAS